MKIIRDLNQGSYSFKKPVATVGSFDGVHRGHQSIIKEVLRHADEIGGDGMLIAFDPHPQAIISPQNAPLVLTTESEKLEILTGLGLHFVIILPFTKELSMMPAEKFVKQYLYEKIGVKELVMGFNHAFGRSREGNIELLREIKGKYGFEVYEVGPIEIDGVSISSTKIRNALLGSDLETVNKFLGRHYSLTGVVIKGSGRGKSLHFPTANLEPESERKLIPPNGVYAVNVQILHDNAGSKVGVANIGIRPTFSEKIRTIEVHLLDFEQDLYGSLLKVEFVQKIRDEKKFFDKDELVLQIMKDVLCAKELLI